MSLSGLTEDVLADPVLAAALEDARTAGVRTRELTGPEALRPFALEVSRLTSSSPPGRITLRPVGAAVAEGVETVERTVDTSGAPTERAPSLPPAAVSVEPGGLAFGVGSDDGAVRASSLPAPPRRTCSARASPTSARTASPRPRRASACDRDARARSA